MLVAEPSVRVEVPSVPGFQMKPAVSVVLPPRSNSLVEVVREMTLVEVLSVQMSEGFEDEVEVDVVQLVPSLRHTVLPWMRREEPEAEVKARTVEVELVERRLLVVRLVLETVAAVRLVVTARLVVVALVAVRLVLETESETILVDVTVPTFKPNHLREEEPREKTESAVGRTSELMVPLRVKREPLFTRVFVRVVRPRTERLPVVVVSPRRLIVKTSPVEVVVPFRR